MKSHLASRTAVVYVVALVLLAGTAGAGKADLITLNAVDAGWYNEFGFHDPDNINYIAGFVSSPPAFVRSLRYYLPF